MPTRRRAPAARFRGLIEPVEPRLLFSADVLAVMALEPGSDTSPDPVPQVQMLPAAPSASDDQQTQPTGPQPAQQQPARELVFVDAGVQDADAFIDALLKQGDAERFEVHRLTADRDGIAQIGEVLEGRQGISAIHLISHGADGQLRLGDTVLTAANLSDHASALSAWSGALDGDADILIYGCDMAASSTGQALVHDIGLLTGADVAASSDATGHADRGGDWILEYSEGRIEAAIAPDQALRQGWDGLLALITSGGETTVNATTAGSQTTTTQRQVGIDASGNHVTVWQSGSAIRARVLDASGAQVVGEFQVTASGTQAQVAMNASGQFVVVWNDGSGINAQRYNANGSTSGAVITVSTDSTARAPAVALNDAGNFAISWSEHYFDNSFNYYRDGLAAVYSWSGVVRAPFTFSGGTNNNYSDSGNTQPLSTSVAINSAGKIAVVTDLGGMIVGTTDIWLWTFNADGSAGALVKQQVNSANGSADPTVGLDDSDNIAIAWTANNDIYSRRATFAAGVTGSDALVNTVTTNNQSLASIGMDVATGRYIVTYQDSVNSNDVFMREYDATGTAVAAESRVNTTTSGSQSAPSAAYRGNNAVVVWTGPANSNDIISQRLTMAPNVAPVNTVPSGLQYARENMPKVFSTANGNRISIADADAGGAEVRVTLTATSGTLSLAGTGGLTFTAGDGTQDATMTFRGTVTAINAALDGLSYTGDADFHGMASLTIATNDRGNTGTGGAKSDTDVLTLLVAPVNDASVNTVPGVQALNEDGTLVLSAANGNAITVADVDAASVQITLSAGQGRLTLAQLTGLSFTAGDGTQDTTMTFSGTVANVNAALNGLVYAPNADYNGADAITIASQDGTLATLNVDTSLRGRYTFENTGALGTDSSPAGNHNATVTNVTAVNDATRGNVADMSGNGNIQVNNRMGAPTNVTVAAWIKVDAADKWGTSVITIGDTINLVVDESFLGDKLAGYFHNGSSYFKTTFDVTLAGTGWHHVAYTVDSTNDTQVLYLDGVAVSATSFTQNVSYNQETITRIGKFARSGFDDGHNLDGSIDEARIYARALDADEIAALASDLPAPNTDTDNATLNIAAVNDAPVLTGTSPFNSITEDDTANNGQLVSSLFTSTDVDSGAASGIAIHTVNAGNGSWQYSTNGGGNWSNVGTVSSSSSLLLRATDRVRFVPDGANATSGSIGYHAWDQTSGTAGSKVSTAARGGTTAFSTAGGSSAITVTAVNDAPEADDDAASTPLATPVDIDVLANDSDVDHAIATLTVVIVSSSAGTSASVNPDGSIHFDPGAQTGVQTVIYRLVDPDGATSNDATVTVTVAANTAPTGADGSDTFDEDDSFTMQASDFGFADADLGQSFGGIRIETLPGFGHLTRNGVAVVVGEVISAADIDAGRLVFTPDADQNGSTAMSFKVRDNLGRLSDLANTFTFHVSPLNDAPVNTVPGNQTGNEDAPITFGTLGGNALAVSDVDAGAGSLRITLSVSHGSLTLAGIAGLVFTTGDGAGDATMVFSGSVADINAALDGMQYTPVSNYHGADTLAMLSEDQGQSGSGGSLSDSSSVGITVQPVNDAPLLTSTQDFTPIGEDDTAGAGQLVSSLLTASDVDAGAASGIALYDLASARGTWQYSTNGGANWTQVGPVSASSALLLRATDRLRFVPDGIDADTASVSFHAWDRTSGVAGVKVDASARGGTTAFSLASGSSSITVGAVNDAPVLSGVNDFAGIGEDPAVNGGTLVSTLIAGQITDVDGGALAGIAVTGVDNAHGIWQYTLDGGNWLAFGSPGDAAARLLAADATTAIRFVPAPDWHGGASITLRAWDRSTGAAGGVADASAGGGTSAFSAATASPAIVVSPVNDAPVLTGIEDFTGITEDEISGTGTLVADLLAGHVADADGAVASGIAVTGVDNAHGNWEYTLDGSTWLALGSPTAATARLLAADATTAIRFLPDADWHGSAAITLRAWDLGGGAAGGVGDASTGGGATPFSAALASPAIVVSPVNDAPVLTALHDLTAIAEDEISGSGTLVATLTAGQITDVDSGALTGLAVTGVDNAHGAWQYTLDGSTWLAFGNPATGAARLLAADATTAIRFIAAPDWHGAAALTARAWDRSSGVAGDVLDAGAPGGSSAFSTVDAVSMIAVSAVNDAPVLSLPSPQTLLMDASVRFAMGQGNGIAVTDVDAGGSPLQLELSVAHGVLTLGDVSGLSFLVGDGLADAQMRVQGSQSQLNTAIAGLRYQPLAGYVGPDALTLAVSDLGGSGAGGAQAASGSVEIAVVSPPGWLPSGPAAPDSGSSGVGGDIGGNIGGGVGTGDPGVIPSPGSGDDQGGGPQVGRGDQGDALAAFPALRVEEARAGSQGPAPMPARAGWAYGPVTLPTDFKTVQQLLEQLQRQAELLREPGALTIGAITPPSYEAWLSPASSPVRRLLDAPVDVRVAASVTYATGLSLTLGTIWWSARISGLITSAILSAPAWRNIDPLPIIDAADDDDDHDGGPQAASGHPDEHHEVERMFDADAGQEPADMALIR